MILEMIKNKIQKQFHVWKNYYEHPYEGKVFYDDYITGKKTNKLYSFASHGIVIMFNNKAIYRILARIEYF